jgi:hypothetical protein
LVYFDEKRNAFLFARQITGSILPRKGVTLMNTTAQKIALGATAALLAVSAVPAFASEQATGEAGAAAGQANAPGIQCRLTAAEKGGAALKAARAAFLAAKQPAIDAHTAAIKAAKDARLAAMKAAEEAYKVSQDKEALKAARLKADADGKAALAAAKTARETALAAAKDTFSAAIKAAKEGWLADRAACVKKPTEKQKEKPQGTEPVGGAVNAPTNSESQQQ